MHLWFTVLYNFRYEKYINFGDFVPNDLTLFVNANVSTYGAGADDSRLTKLQNIFTSENFVWPKNHESVENFNEHTVSYIGVYGGLSTGRIFVA